MNDTNRRPSSSFGNRTIRVLADLTARVLLGGAVGVAVLPYIAREVLLWDISLKWALPISASIGAIVGIFCIRKGPGII